MESSGHRLAHCKKSLGRQATSQRGADRPPCFLAEGWISLGRGVGAEGRCLACKAPPVNQDYLPPTGTLVVAPDPDPTGTLTPTLTDPPPARMPSLAATVVMNVFTMVFRYRFSVLKGLLGT